MSQSISKSVGKASQPRVKNLNGDVKTIQKLLNAQKPKVKLKEDGLIGPKTIKAIEAFQKSIVKMSKPDGIVDPYGTTLKKLNAATGSALITLPSGPYRTYAPAKDQYGTASTLASLKKAGRVFYAKHRVRFSIGHISLAAGGKMPPHKSHQKGTDVDIRPLRTDKKNQPVTISNAAYSQTLTAALVAILLKDPNCKGILFNDKKIKGVKQWPGHHNHLHVKFKK